MGEPAPPKRRIITTKKTMTVPVSKMSSPCVSQIVGCGSKRDRKR
jgi:hypothetical protein